MKFKKEFSDFNRRNVFLSVLSLFLLLFLVAMAMIFLQRSLRGEKQKATDESGSAHGEVDLESGHALSRFEENEDKKINSYGWVDRKKKIVHIPILRAMEISAAKEKQ